LEHTVDDSKANIFILKAKENVDFEFMEKQSQNGQDFWSEVVNPLNKVFRFQWEP